MPHYYTPTIEEFHVGFEYEVRSGDQWVPHVLTVEDLKELHHTLDSLPYGTVRVKHLDKDDLEELLWKEKGIIALYVSGEATLITYQHGHYMLYCHEDGLSTIARFVKEQREYVKVFIGTLRNKSELARVMKQVGIEREVKNPINK